MARVLLVDSEPMRSAGNQGELTRAGHDVTVAPSGAFALTMLERARPDVIVSWLRIEDMPAYELCAIVRSDPMTRTVPFILLTDRGPSSPEVIAQAVADLPAVEDPATAGSSSDGSVHPESESSVGTHVAAGLAVAPFIPDALQTTELREAFLAVTDGKKTGRLVASVGAAEGTLVFKAGRLVHAEFERQRGEVAVTSLLVAATSGPCGRYRFLPWDGSEVPRRTWTIDHGAEQLLLRTWTETNESEVAQDSTPCPSAADGSATSLRGS